MHFFLFTATETILLTLREISCRKFINFLLFISSLFLKSVCSMKLFNNICILEFVWMWFNFLKTIVLVFKLNNYLKKFVLLSCCYSYCECVCVWRSKSFKLVHVLYFILSRHWIVWSSVPFCLFKYRKFCSTHCS